MKLGAVAANLETATRAGEFAVLCRGLMQARGDPLFAAGLVERTSPRVAEILKSAVTAGNLADATSAGNLAPYSAAVAGFIDSLRNAGAFDRLLPDMRRLPFRTTIMIVTSAATASITGESDVKPISRLSLENGTLDQRKATAIVAMSNELVRLAGSDGAALIGRELRGAVASATDAEFIRLITDGISSIASSRNDSRRRFGKIWN